MEILARLIAVGLIIFLVNLLFRPDSDRIEGLTPSRVVAYGWRFRTFVLIFAFAIYGISITLLLRGVVEDKAELVSMVLLLGYASYGVLEVFFVKIFFDSEGFTTRSPWRRRRRIAWTDVGERGFSHINQWHLLKTKDKGTVRVSAYLTGLNSFFDELDCKSSASQI